MPSDYLEQALINLWTIVLSSWRRPFPCVRVGSVSIRAVRRCSSRLGLIPLSWLTESRALPRTSTVSLRSLPGWCGIRVSNSGCGLESQNLPKWFYPNLLPIAIESSALLWRGGRLQPRLHPCRPKGGTLGEPSMLS